jgi:hypothetical protein
MNIHRLEQDKDTSDMKNEEINLLASIRWLRHTE